MVGEAIVVPRAPWRRDAGNGQLYGAAAAAVELDQEHALPGPELDLTGRDVEGLGSAQQHGAGVGIAVLALVRGVRPLAGVEVIVEPALAAWREALEQQAKVRKDGTLPWLLPDAKSQLTFIYEDGRPVGIDAIVLSTQHTKEVSNEDIRAGVIEHVIKPIIPEEWLAGVAANKIHVNPTGRFETGGPEGDCGLTGRKIIVDTYGGMARHGGGAFSGKDPTKVDRSACYMSRYIAKNLVAAGLADRIEVQLAYAIGVAEPVSVIVNTYDTGKLPESELVDLVRANFKLSPAGIMETLDLRKPIYRNTASYGHFGRREPGFTWELTNVVDRLKKGAGV